MLHIEQVNKRFGRKQILHDITCTLTPGVYGLLGPNGAGKTTLMRCIAGLYPYEGKITFEGSDTRSGDALLSTLGYLPQKFGLYKDLTVYECLDLLADLKKLPLKGRKEEIERCVSLVNLTDRMNSRIRTLSGGMVRRVGIAQSLLGDPKVLIFDEPTAGLDPEERMRFQMLISRIRKDRIILISTHIVSDIEALSDRVVVMREGRTVADLTLEELRRVASGKVYSVPDAKLSELSEPFVLRGRSEKEGEGIVCQVISASVQKFPTSEPTVEDGYLCLLHGL